MAAEIEQMAFVGEVPWHGLGNSIDENTSIEEWQKAAGLDWSVSKRPVLFQHADGYEPQAFKDKFVLVRDTDHKPFSVVSGRYKPVQPKEVLEFFRDLVSNFGMKIETAGSLRDGQRIWALARTGDAHKVMGVDKVDSYLMLATSYDLTFSTIAQFTSVRVVCNNTLQQSFKQHSGRVSIPHVRDFNMEAIKSELGVGHEHWQLFVDTMDALARIKLDSVKAREITAKVFNVTQAWETPETKKSENHVAITHCDKIIQLFDGRAKGADIAGQTGWGLVNAVTQYVDFEKRARGQSSRLDNAWFGEGAILKQRAVDETLLLAA